MGRLVDVVKARSMGDQRVGSSMGSAEVKSLERGAVNRASDRACHKGPDGSVARAISNMQVEVDSMKQS